MKKIVMLLVAFSLICLVVVWASAADSTTVNGTVSDSMCGAKGANADHAGCMKKCMGKGAQAVIVSDSDQKVYTVSNADAVKGHEGHHVAATGHVDGTSIHIDSLKML